MPPQNPRKLRKFLLFGGVTLTLVALLILVTVLALRTSSLEPEIAKLRAAGLPVTIEDLNTWYLAVPTTSNAALRVIDAIDLRNTKHSQFQLPKRGELIPAETLSALRDYVTDNPDTLETLHAALQLPESRYPLTLSSNTIAAGPANPHLGPIKALAQLLNYQTIHLVSQGKGDQAFIPIRYGFALAATLRNEPMLISELVRIACAAIALRSLECALPTGQLTEPQLREISEWLARTEADCSRSFQRAIIGERAYGLQNYYSILQSLLQSSAAGDLRATVYRNFGFHDRDLRLYLELMNRFSSSMTNPFPTAYQQSLALETELTNQFSRGLSRFAFVSRAILPAIIKATGKESALVTHLRCAQTAVAIERYRLANNGTLPANLQQLVPTCVPSLPRDAALGEPLQFEKLPTGYQITSPAAAKILDNKISTTFPVVPWNFAGK